MAAKFAKLARVTFYKDSGGWYAQTFPMNPAIPKRPPDGPFSDLKSAIEQLHKELKLRQFTRQGRLKKGKFSLDVCERLDLS